MSSVSTSLSSIRIVPAAGASPVGVGKYRYIALIAEGGMAHVYLAVTKASGTFEKLVVIKQLREELAEDPTFVTMFVDEARLAARLNHPNVVQTHEVGSEGGRHYIAMEFLEGVPYTKLSRLRERIPAPLAFHVRILCDLLEGLHYAHELRDFDGKPLGVVHRDVSPQNVMLTFAGGVKVLDFGIAKASLAAEQRPDDFKGKLEYMAPEQARLEVVDRRADIFSVGIMLWEAIARQRIYARGEDKLARLVAGDHPDVLTVRPDAPRRLAKICSRALASEREGRYATALEMAQELEEWLEGTTQHIATRDLGRYLAEKFSSTRTKLTEAVEAQLRVFRDLPEDSQDPMELARIPIAEVSTAELSGSEPPPPVAQSAPPPDGQAGTTAPSAWASEPSLPGPLRAPSLSGRPPPPLTPRSQAVVVIMACAGLVLSAALVGGVLFARSRTRAKDADARAAASASVAANGTGGTPRTSSDPAPTINFTITASPATAHIAVDGQRHASNPATGRVPIDGALHVIRVEAEGFEPKEQQLTFDRTFFVTLELKPLAAPSVATSAVQTKGVVPQGTRTGTGTRPPRGGAIDTDNPYK